MNQTHAKTRRRGALPSLDALRGFEAAARLMSFTRAAGELFVTQSAVSRQIRSVESALGMPLFHRHNRRLELTPAGERMQRAVTRALAEVEAAVVEVRGETSRVVTVTTPLSFAALWLVPRLAAFRRAHPEIDLRIAANDAVVSLEQERMDCAIRFCEPEAAPRDAVPLMREEAFPVVAPALLKDRSRPLKTPADLKHHVLLRYEDARGRVPSVDWSNWLALWKVPDLKPAGTLSFSHYDQAIAAALEGEGVAIGRTPHIRRLLKAGKLVPPFANRMTVPRQHFMIVARGSRHRAEVKAFEAWVLAEAEGDRPD
jgi:DNA-binding transcriptional LysR family regulator